VAVGIAVGLALVPACSDGGDEDGAGTGRDAVDEVVALGDEVAAGEASATVTTVAPVEATAEVYAADGDRIAVEVTVCGDAEAVAGLWTLHVGDDVLEPVPLPPDALPEENRPTFDFTAGPGPDGCRTGWVAWDLPAGGSDGAGVLVWEGDADVGWPAETT